MPASAKASGLKSPLKMQAPEASCDDCTAGEALGVAMLMAIPWPFDASFLAGMICLGPDVGEDEIADERGDTAAAELAQLVLLDVVQRDLQRFLALQVRLGAHGVLLVMRWFRISG
jgi:hypothetical protein